MYPAARLPFAEFGVYKNNNLTSASVFDFYNKLIDGPNKREFSNFDAFNVALDQTFWHDRVGFQWEFDDPAKGWTPRGDPFHSALSGGNEEGYATFAYCTLSKPGHYRVRVLTEDGREIGRKSFNFVVGEPPEPVEALD